MKCAISISIFGLSLLASSLSAPSTVFDLTSVNFDGVTKSEVSPVLIAFVAPWCPHSRALAPAYEDVAAHFERFRLGRSIDSPGDAVIELTSAAGVESTKLVVIARCDATREVELSAAHEIEGYPTLIWYFRGEMTRYSGTSFSTADMTSWIVDMGRLSKAWGSTPRSVLDHTLAFSLPNPKAVHLTAATFEAQVYDPSRTAIVAFVAPWCVHCAEFGSVFEKLATVFEDEPTVLVATIDAALNRDIAERYDISGFPSLKMFPYGDAPHVTVFVDDLPLEANGDVEAWGDKALGALVALVNEKAATARLPNGSLSSNFGRVQSFETFLKTRLVLLSDASETRMIGVDVSAAVLAPDGTVDPALHNSSLPGNSSVADQPRSFESAMGEAGAIVAGLEGEARKHADNYIQAISKMRNGGAPWLVGEISRLKGVVSSGSVGGVKKGSLTRRLNVLEALLDLKRQHL